MNRSRTFLPTITLAGFAAVCALLASCAAGYQTPPPGGPKDTTAPSVLSTVPVSGTVSFHEQTISVEFSEPISESSVSGGAVVITPIPVTPPEFDVSGSTVEITFSKPLLPDRTYAVTISASVTDLAGNRIGDPITLRFATGEKIDSARIVGEVQGHATGKAFIFAYRLPADTAGRIDTARFNASFRPDTVHPDFIAPIADNGSFSLEGLPPGTFRLFAVVDTYGDQFFTPGLDAFGAATGDVRVSGPAETVTGITLSLRPAPDDIAPPALYSARSIGPDRTELKFSEPPDTTSLRPANIVLRVGGSSIAPTSLWRSRTAPLIVQVLHPVLPVDSTVDVQVHDIRDTVGNVIADTAGHTTFVVSTATDTAAPALVPLPFDSTKAYAFPDSFLVAFDMPVRLASLDETVSMRDSAGTRARFRLVQRSPMEFVARPLDTLSGGMRGTVEVAFGNVTSARGVRRDSTARIRIVIAQSRQRGTLDGTLADSSAPKALHVITARAVGTGGGTYTLTGIRPGAWSFPSIPEGEYEVSVFRDDNGDGLFSYGTLLPYHPAEVAVTWHGTVRVRPRWTTNKVELIFR